MADPIKFDDTVSYLLAKVSTAFRKSLERHLSRIDLHGGQIFVLFELWKKDGLRQIDLAKCLDLSAPTVNKTVKGLTDIGLVSCSRIDDDARSTRIFLTDLGRRVRGDIEAQWLELEEDCLSGLTETERLILFELLGKLRSTYTGRPAGDEDD
ncbi:MAG: MarR family winged helix-turn-helix transcriptional regulator [Acidobacteriota bacterium]